MAYMFLATCKEGIACMDGLRMINYWLLFRANVPHDIRASSKVISRSPRENIT